MNSPIQISVIAIFAIAIIFGTVYVLETVGIVSSPLSFTQSTLDDEFFFGKNTQQSTLLQSESWIETKLIFANGIKTSKTESVINTNFKPFSLVSVNDPELSPLTRAELFVYTDFSKLGKNLKFDFPRTTITQYVTVNGIPVNVYRQLLLENVYTESTGTLKGAGLAITPDFFESIIKQGTSLKSGDVIELIMKVSGRYTVVEVEEDFSKPETRFIQTGKQWDGYIEGLNTSVVFIYYTPEDILKIRAGLITNPSSMFESCPDANSNGICDSNDPTIVTTQTVNPTTNTVTTNTVIEQPPVESQTSVSGSAGQPIFGNTLPETTSSDTNIYSSTTTTIGENPVGSSGVTVACDPTVTNCPETIQNIVNKVAEKRESDSNGFVILLVMIGLISVVVVYIVISKVKHK